MSFIEAANPVVFLPGAGGEILNLAAFSVPQFGTTHFQTIRYPGWERYEDPGFSAETLIEELAVQIDTKVPSGPIHIVGLSIGGHFGYATALRLQKMGREIGALCAVDSSMITSAGPSIGWKRRALAEVLEMLRKGRGKELMRFMKSKFWRALIRFSGGRTRSLLGRLASNTRSVAEPNPVLESELSMRLLVRLCVPWLLSLDRDPTVLSVPVALLRTQRASGDDAAWRRRCPNVRCFEIYGGHGTLFHPENIDAFRVAFIQATSGWR
jgi:thioesterase domain-containing protein